MADQNLSEQQIEAQLREADAQLDVLQARADARKAREEMAEISGLAELCQDGTTWEKDLWVTYKRVG